MRHLVELERPVIGSPFARESLPSPSIRIGEVYVVFTSLEGTLAAARVAHDLAGGLGAPLTLIDFRMVPYPGEVESPGMRSPVEAAAFLEQVRREGIELRARVYLCRDARKAFPAAFRRHSLIVIGGVRRWWPTRPERWRRDLEAAGHFVVFVDEHDHARQVEPMVAIRTA
jgi:hypothetical protein